jgi:DNA primase
MHLAGVTTAVASCGTAFGDEHLAMLRRLMMDDSFFRGELIYVFDGDAAGRAAAIKAFGGEQNLAGQSFVAVAPDGMDPCDLRLKSGDSALRDLVARRTPLFEFAIRTAMAEFDLDNAEGRVTALRRCIPMVAQIKDPTLRDEYARQLAGWVGWDDVAQIIDRVRGEARKSKAPAARSGSPNPRRRGAEQPAEGAPAEPAARPDPRDPTLWPQREALKSALQYPAFAGPVFDTLTVESFTHPGYAAVREAIDAAGGTSTGTTGAQWIDAVRHRTTSALTAGLINELGVESVAVDDERLPRYVAGVLARLQEVWMGRQIAEVKSKLQRMSPIEQGDEYHALFGDLVAMEAYRRSLLEQASGDDLTA